jgi:hypothetical protein
VSGGARDSADARLIVELLDGKTHEDAARVVGISSATVRRRLADPAFRAQLDAARQELVAGTVAMLAGSATRAADTLAGLLDAENESVRFRAAQAILELVDKLGSTRDLDVRLEGIEEALGIDPRTGWRKAAA